MLEEEAQLSRDHLRFRSSHGCAQCTKGLSDLVGISGRTVAAEIIEPSQEPEFLLGLRANDGLALHRWFEQRKRSPIKDSNMQGKSARQCALFKVWSGLLDPRTVEQTFGTISSMRESSRAPL
jgi:general secretion pathway protein E